ncbi:MAG: hypothetical protein JXR67_03425 [Bacteroidales bacterium]|nr:hypothetical protein [Bacteroidales bacterium]
MTKVNDSYDKLVRILRNSRPDLLHPDIIENEIMGRIQRQNQGRGRFSEFVDALFGWVYIGWVRRSLIGVSVVLVAIFAYQQAFILRQVKNIGKQVVIMGSESSAVSSSALDKRLTLYKMSARLSPDGEIRISESLLEDLLDSYNDLQIKYKDLLRIIEADPELKGHIEKMLKEDKRYKPDI